MILVSTLYDEYIDRRKLSEQKKPFEYIVPPTSRGVGTIKLSKNGQERGWSIKCKCTLPKLLVSSFSFYSETLFVDLLEGDRCNFF